jgi:DNA invertase Pin-like site-specific DNA recombinase
MTYAVIYVRFSPRRNGDTCESNEVQLAYCRECCARQGYTEEGWFGDENAKGDDEKRQGLWDAVEACKRGYVLLVYKYDRLARSVYLDEYIRREVAKKGARIEAVVGGRDGDSPQDVMVRQILAAVAQNEKAIIAARTSASMRHHQKNGRLMSRHPPYGTMRGPERWRFRNGERVLERTIVPNLEEQEIAQQIRQWHSEGMTPTEIVRKLADAQAPSRGSGWYPRTVQRICERD